MKLKKILRLIGNKKTENVEAVADRWLLAIQKRNTGEKAYLDRVLMVRKYIKPYLGDMLIADVKQEHLDVLFDSMSAQGYRHGRIQKVFFVCNGIFRMAVANQLIQINPCDNFILPRGLPNQNRREATIEERNDYVGRLLWLDLVILCGLRPGETERIRYSDVGDGYLWVDGTKTRDAKRYVPLPANLQDRILSEPHKQGDYVCKISERRRGYVFRALKGEMGAENSDLSPYCFRHSYITDIVNNPEIPLSTSKKLSGHAVHGETNRYTHTRPQIATDVLHAVTGYWEKIGFDYAADKPIFKCKKEGH